jgi:glucose-1-phosphate adenylyltransferase
MPHIAVARDVTDHTVAVVLAGGKGTRLDPLTRNVCKPALPFGAAFRCIDFTLSNCVNSGVQTIGVATRYKPESLLAHLASHWSDTTGARSEPIIQAWRAEERAGSAGHCGTAHAVYRNLPSIRASGRSLVLILAGDHIYKMDYRPMLEAHCARNAAVTIGCVEASTDDACQFGVLAVGDDGRVEHFTEKPRSPPDICSATDGGTLVSMGIYVFDAAFLERVLVIDAARLASGHDFGVDILPRCLGSSRVFSHAFREPDGSLDRPYWRDIGTLRAYWQAHMDLLGPTPLLALDEASWPIGSGGARPRIIETAIATARGGTIEDVIVGTGCNVAGHVLHSVLFDGAEIGDGTMIADSVVLPGARVGAGVRLRGVIVDTGCRVSEGTVVEREASAADPIVLTSNRECCQLLEGPPRRGVPGNSVAVSAAQADRERRDIARI